MGRASRRTVGLPRTPERSPRGSGAGRRAIDPVRAAALALLIEAEATPAPIKEALDRAETRLPRDQDRALLHSLVNETLRHRPRLDDTLAPWIAPRLLAELEPAVRNLLRLGLAQLVLHDRIPPHAAVDTAVSLAHHELHAGAAGFINAVLRRAVREGLTRWRGPQAASIETLSEPRQLAVHFSTPEWLVRRWIERWGLERARRALAAGAETPATWVRFRADQLGLVQGTATAAQIPIPADLAAELGLEDDSRHSWLPGVARVPAGTRPATLPGFRQGRYTIQDPSAVAVGWLPPVVRGRILDACAAPGTKTGHLLERAEAGTRLLALDRTRSRQALVRQGLLRLGLEADCVVGDARHLPFAPGFEGILIDAPCSNLGVLRRRVEVRWRSFEESLVRLADTQAAILRAAARALLPGGWLVYSVCTTEPEETTRQRDRFFEEQNAFEPCPLPDLVPVAARGREGELILIPGELETDGGYAFVVVKTGPGSEGSAGA